MYKIEFQNMKKLLFLLLVIVFNGFCQEKHQNKINADVINHFFTTYNSMRNFEYKYAENASSDLENSIIEYNSKLCTIIKSPEFSSLDDEAIKKIADSTEAKFIKSNDNKLKMFSWGVFESLQIPFYSNLLMSNNTRSNMISRNSNDNNDFGENVQYDSIIDITIQNKSYYVLLGSNKCGNLCLYKTASVYSIIDFAIVKCINVFFDGKNYLSDIKFDYLINENIKAEPAFSLKNNQIECPVFNNDKTRLTGTVLYNLIIK